MSFEYEIRGNYGYGWEVVTTEGTLAEARERLREYRENEPGTAHKIVRVRTDKTIKPTYPKFGSGTGGGE